MIFIGAFVIQFPDRIQKMNFTGRVISENRDVFIQNEGYLQFRDPANARQFKLAMAEVAQSGSAILRVNEAKNTPSLVFRMRAGVEPQTMLMIGMRLDQTVPIDPMSLVELLPLRRGEALVAALLADGHDVPTIATRSGVTLETARTYLKRAMAATGTHSQAQLVALVLRCAAISISPLPLDKVCSRSLSENSLADAG